MTQRLLGILLALVLLVGAGNAFAQENLEQKNKDIRKLLKLVGAGELGIKMMDEMIVAFKEEMPDVPEKFWKEFRAEVNADKLSDLAVPIYAKYFTHKDVTELIKFYESPLGAKLLKYQPKVMEETAEFANRWGEDLGRGLVEKLEKQGYE